MRSSRPETAPVRTHRRSEEPRDFNQLGLDFPAAAEYSVAPRKETEIMNQELVDVLEQKIGDLVERYNALKEENARLHAEIQQSASDREGLKSRVDAILGKLDGI